MDTINYVFSIGKRCNSTDLLRAYKFTKFAGPFDWTIIDFQSACAEIATGFEHYLDSVVPYNSIGYPTIGKVQYLIQDWSGLVLPLNTKHLPKELGTDAYTWDPICLFRHHNVDDPKVRDQLRRRVSRFNKVYNGHPEGVLLFHMSGVVVDWREYMGDIVKCRNNYSIKGQLVVLVCTPNTAVTSVEWVEGVCFIIKKVPPLAEQVKHATDNDIHVINFDDVNLKLREMFRFDLLEMPQLINRMRFKGGLQKGYPTTQI